MGNEFSGLDEAFADFFDAQRSDGNLRKSFGAVALRPQAEREYATHAKVDLGNIAEIGYRK